MQEKEDTIVSRREFLARDERISRRGFNNTIDEAGSRESRNARPKLGWPPKQPVLTWSCSRSCPRCSCRGVIHRRFALPRKKPRASRDKNLCTSHPGSPRWSTRNAARREEISRRYSWRARARKTREHHRDETRATKSVSVLTPDAAAALLLTRTTMRRHIAARSAGRSGK